MLIFKYPIIVYDKKLIVDYSLEIVIAIINNDYFEHLCHCLKLHSIFVYKIYLKKAENTLPQLL